MNNVPSSIKDKVKNHPEYAKGKKKQQQLNDAKNQIKQKKLNMSKTADILIAIGIVVVATLTWFFPGDDLVAWTNLIRAIGC